MVMNLVLALLVMSVMLTLYHILMLHMLKRKSVLS